MLVHQQILARAAAAPSAPAVYDGPAAHTYADLVRAAVTLEHALSASGRGGAPVSTTEIVALVLPRSR